MIHVITEGEYSDYSVIGLVEGEGNLEELKKEFEETTGVKCSYVFPEDYEEEKKKLDELKKLLETDEDGVRDLFYLWLIKVKGFKKVTWEEFHAGSY